MSDVTRRPRYHLISCAGFPNYGDELIAGRWLDHLAEVAPEADVWLDCPHPGNAAVLLDGRHPRARFVDTAWKLCWEAPCDRVLDVASWVQSAVHDPGRAPRFTEGIDLLATADVVHLLGGGYATEVWPRQVGLLAVARAAARRSSGRAVATGAGLTPASPSTARLVGALLADFAVVDVRDAPSAALLPDRAVSVTGDDALLGDGPRHPQAAGAPSTMLCLQSDLLGDEAARDLAAWIVATLRSWEVEPGDVGVVEGIPGHDRFLYGLIEHELPGVRFYPFVEVWAQGLPAAPHQTWLSTRFHLHQEASRAGASGLALDTGSHYYATKHASLIERGSGWTLSADLTSLPDRPRGSFDPAQLARLQAAKRALVDTIYAPHDEGVTAVEFAPAIGGTARVRSRWRVRGRS